MSWQETLYVLSVMSEMELASSKIGGVIPRDRVLHTATNNAHIDLNTAASDYFGEVPIVEVSGAGTVVGLEVFATKNSGAAGSCKNVLKMIIDGSQEYTITADTSDGTQKGTMKLDLNKNYVEKSVKDGGDYGTNKEYVMNKDLKFKKSLHCYCSQSASSTNGSGYRPSFEAGGTIEYILDPGEGGVTRKLTQIMHARAIVPNIDFEGRCAA